MKYLIACLMLLLMHQSVIAHEFIEQLKERSSEFDNCEFTIEHHLTYLPMFDSEDDARMYATNLVNDRAGMASQPIPDNKITNMIDKQVNFFMNGSESYLKYICKIENIDNFSLFIFDNQNALFQALVFLKDGEFNYYVKENVATLNLKTHRKRYMTMLFEHEKIFKSDRDIKFIFPDESENIIFNNNNRINKIYALTYERISDYFPIKFKITTDNDGFGEIVMSDFENHNGKTIPTYIERLYYEKHPVYNKIFLENKAIQTIKDFTFNKQTIDWLIPAGINIQNRISGHNFTVSEPLLVSELINESKGGEK